MQIIGGTESAAVELTGFGMAINALSRLLVGISEADWSTVDHLVDSGYEVVRQAGRREFLAQFNLAKAEATVRRLRGAAANADLISSAILACDEALDIAERDQLPLIVAEALRIRGSLQGIAGERQKAIHDFERSFEIASERHMRPLITDIRIDRLWAFGHSDTYPWGTPLDDLEVAGRLVDECEYRYRDKDIELLSASLYQEN